MTVQSRKAGGTESGLQESGRFFLFASGSFLPDDGVSDSINEFWRCFLDHRAEFAKAGSIDDPVCDVILDALQRVNPGLWFEFCTNPGVHEFIVSAEGKRALFPLVEEIVAKAPEMEEWKIFALKPKLGFPVWNIWEGHEVAIADVVFLPVFHQETRELGLQLFVDGLNEDNKDDAHNALLRAIDHGLGERRFADEVRATWVHPLSELPEGRLAVPLVELEAYLDGLESDRSS
jgi:hypothetical protein